MIAFIRAELYILSLRLWTRHARGHCWRLQDGPYTARERLLWAAAVSPHVAAGRRRDCRYAALLWRAAQRLKAER